MQDLIYISEIEFATPAYDQSIQLRYEILRQPLGLDFSVEELSAEYDSHHLACYQMVDEDIIGILVLKPIDDQVVKMRQVAVRSDMQEHGIGRLMVAESERFAKSKNFTKIELAARMTVVPFYEKLGYISVGQPFIEVGIDHQKMEKGL
jgi:predicted GNAT family N-acyltransferase